MRTRHWRPLGLGAALAVLTLVLFLPQARAAGPAGDPRDKFLGGSTITIPADETVSHDLYIVGNTVRVDGRIDGDLFVAGSTVEVTGPVSGDLFVAGGNVTIASPVGRHLRVAGGNVTVTGPVKQDLLAAAGTLNVTATSRVGGDLIFSGGTTTLDGADDGSVLGSASSYTNAGQVGGSENVTLNQTKQQAAQSPSLASRLLDQVRRYVSVVVIGALLLGLIPSLIKTAAATVDERPAPSFGIGILTFVGFFVLIVALIIGMILLAILLHLLTLGGLALTVVFGILLGMSALSFLFAIILAFVAAAVVGLALGRLALGRLPSGQVPATWAERPWVPLLLGVLAVIVLTALPLVGGILNFVVVLFGLGALAIVVWSAANGGALTRPNDSPSVAAG